MASKWTPHEVKEGCENLNPIIFGQMGPIWSQNIKKINFGKKNPTGLHTIPHYLSKHLVHGALLAFEL